MPGPPPPPSPSGNEESDEHRRERLRREERAAALGLTSTGLWLHEGLERLRAEIAAAPAARQRARCEEELASKRGFLELCARNHMDFTLDERARVEVEARRLEAILADDAALRAFTGGGDAVLLDLARRFPLDGPVQPPPGPAGSDFPGPPPGPPTPGLTDLGPQKEGRS